MLYAGSYCGSLKGAWRTTDSNDSGNRACLSSKVYGLSWKEMRLDDFGYLLVLLDFLGTFSVWTGAGFVD